MILPMTERTSECDDDVLRRAAAGDAPAFEQLIRSHERQVLRLAVRLTGRLEDGQDVAQEAFLKLHRQLARFPDKNQIGAWLYRVPVNLCWHLDPKTKRSPAPTIARPATT